MALFDARFEVRGKVKVGERRQLASGKEIPASTDYFVCSDPEFQQLYPGQPKQIRIVLPYDSADDCFPQTLEAWRGKILACHSTDGKAARRRSKNGVTFDADADPMDIPCPYRQCSWFKVPEGGGQRACKPTARLRFFLAGGSDRSAVLEFPTHGFATIEGIGAALKLAERAGSLALMEATLTVRVEKKGKSHFPVVSIHLRQGESEVGEADELRKLVAELDCDSPAFRQWVGKVGLEVALAELRKRKAAR